MAQDTQSLQDVTLNKNAQNLLPSESGDKEIGQSINQDLTQNDAVELNDLSKKEETKHQQ